jgi:hypothetical protein
MDNQRCTHLRINGARCAMPAVHGKDLCFTHEARYMRLRSKPSLPNTFAQAPLVGFIYPEDHDSILENIHSICRAMDQSTIDYRNASVMERLMKTALSTINQRERLKDKPPAETPRRIRYDEKANAYALDTVEPGPTSPDPASSAADPAAEPATLPSVTAVADQPESAQPKQFIRVATYGELKPLFSTLAKSGEITRISSNTYQFRDGSLLRTHPSLERTPRNPDRYRGKTYLFFTNMI